MKNSCDKSCFERGFATALIFIIGAVVAVIILLSFELNTPDSAMSANEIAGIFSSISTIVIAVFAFLQYRIYKFTLKNQLFDKRSRVYEGVKLFINAIVDKADLTLEDRATYLESIKGNNFLFYKDIADYLDQILSNAAQLRKFVKQGEQKKADELVDWFVNESLKLDQRFESYLNIYEYE